LQVIPVLIHIFVPAIQTKSKKQASTKGDTEVIHEATLRLLRGIKDHAKTKGKTLKREELLRRGYNKEFVA